MKIVIADSSAVAALLLREEGYEEIADHTKSEQIYTLELAFKESLNATWRRSRQKKLSESQALEILEDLEDARLRHVYQTIDQREFYGEAFRLALRSGKTIYDMLFICAAISRKARLMTRDKEQAELARKLGVTVLLI